jgi:hypothetical protein
MLAVWAVKFSDKIDNVATAALRARSPPAANRRTSSLRQTYR